MLGHSLLQTNGPFLNATGVDMVMLTYPDIKLAPASLRALQAVGWRLREVSLAHRSHCDHLESPELSFN